MNATLTRLGLGFRAWWSSLGGFVTDALLYGVSALFALVMGFTSSQVAQWHWGFLAAGPYAVAALVALSLTKLRLARPQLVRLVLLSLVIVGVVVVPLGLEARWRHEDPNMAQPEVSVIERSGKLLADGKDPYQSYWHDGHVVNEVRDEPAWESFFPYFPLMGIFGLPSATSGKSGGLTDARIIMSASTMAVCAAALALLRVERRRKIRIAQFLVALPTGALFLATGGDDMPILALMLLAVAGLQRRNANVAGISLGVAAAMKFTAWPMALGAVLVARDHEGRSTWRRVSAWVVSIVAVTVVPFAVRSPWAFISNVFAFPLGLAHVTSPAASALPGHIVTTWWAPAGHLLTPLALLVGGYYVARYARDQWPLTLHQVLSVLAVMSAVMICAASATRVGYVIYPINFWVWAKVCEPAPAAVAPESVLV